MPPPAGPALGGPAFGGGMAGGMAPLGAPLAAPKAVPNLGGPTQGMGPPPMGPPLGLSPAAPKAPPQGDPGLAGTLRAPGGLGMGSPVMRAGPAAESMPPPGQTFRAPPSAPLEGAAKPIIARSGEASTVPIASNATHRLIIVQGDQHHYYELPAMGEVSLGRAPTNTLTVDDDGVSRNHCVIQVRNGEFMVKDLKSFNGTFVNGFPVRDQKLEPWDKVQIGGVSIFLACASQSQDSDLEKKLGRYEVLFDLNKAINSVLDRGRLLEMIMDSAIQLCSAERGFIITREPSTGKLRYEVARNIDKVEIFAPEFNTSSHIIEKVLNTGEAVLTSNAQSDFGEFVSIVDLELRSLMCVPLKVKDRVLGTVYLDSRFQGSRFDEEELQLLKAFTDQAAIAIENAQLLESAKNKERQDEELRIASSIQQDLLPRVNPSAPGLIVCGQTIPARQVGGDYYDFVQLPRSPYLYLGIGDVAGKGVPAGLIMVMLRSLIRPIAEIHPRTGDIIREINRFMTSDLKKGIFVSFVLMRWDIQSQRLSFTGAGHEHFVIYKRRSKETRVQKVGGVVLGILEDLSNVITEEEIPLEPGDTVVVYTDGITECPNRHGQEFGLDRLARLVQKMGEAPIEQIRDAIFENVMQFQGGQEQHDDMTLLVLRRE